MDPKKPYLYGSHGMSPKELDAYEDHLADELLRRIGCEDSHDVVVGVGDHEWVVLLRAATTARVRVEEHAGWPVRYDVTGRIVPAGARE
jgi:hypothetical protein